MSRQQLLIAQKQGARPDGYVYTRLQASSKVHAALNKDRLSSLRDFAVRHLILEKQFRSLATWAFVIWRYWGRFFLQMHSKLQKFLAWLRALAG